MGMSSFWKVAHRAILDQWMEKTKDPVYAAFQNRQDPNFLNGFVEALQAEAFRRGQVERERESKRFPIRETEAL